MAVNIGPRIGIDGEKEYRDSLKSIIEQSKTLASEMKALESSFDSETKSLKQNEEQRKLLTEQIKVQEERVEKLASGLEQARSKYDENSTQVRKWQQAVNEATAELNTMKSKLDDLPSQLELVGQKLESVGNKFQTVGNNISKFGAGMTKYITTPIVGAFTASAKSAIDYETAFTGVMKTVDETATTSYQDISDAIKKMATETASSKTDIAAVAEAAGQLGVVADDIAGFTKTMVMLGDTTNLSAEEAASAIARFANVTGMSISDSDRLGATIVDLGNNFATTESEIVEMAQRLSGAGAQIGLTQGEILGFATALSSVGIAAEMGGSAFSKAMTKMQVAAETGYEPMIELEEKTGMSLRELQLMASNNSAGFTKLADSLGMTKSEINSVMSAADNLNSFAEVSGMTTEEFIELYRTDATAALQAFIQGLGDTETSGQSTIAMLQDMGFTEVRLRDTLTRLANSGDLVTNAVNAGNQAWEENTALVEEAEKRYGTTAAQISQAKEELDNLAIEFGTVLLPIIVDVLNDLKPILHDISEAWQAMSPEEQKQFIENMAKLAAAGPAISVAGKAISGLGWGITGVGKALQVFKGAGGAGGIAAIAKAAGSFGAPFAAGIAGAFGGGLVADLLNRYILGPILDFFGSKDASYYKNFSWFGKDGFFETMFGGYEDVTDWWNTMTGAVNLAVDDMKASMELKFKYIDLVASNAWDHMGKKADEFKAGIDVVQKIASNRMEEMHKTFEENGGGISGAMAVAWDNLKKTFEFGFNGLDLITGGKLSEIKDAFFNKFGEIKDEALNWGSEIVSNLAKGISKGIELVGKAAVAVGDTISSYWHFSEPDKGPLSDFNSWMPDMMNQMAGQIEAGRAKVQAAVANVAGDIATPVASSTTMNYGGTTINVYGTEGQDVRELAEIVMDRINMDISKKEAVFA